MDKLTVALYGTALLLFAAALGLQLRSHRQLREHQAVHCGLIQAAYDIIDPEGMAEARQLLDAQRADSRVVTTVDPRQPAAPQPDGSRLIGPDHPMHDQGHQDDPPGVSWADHGEDTR